MDLAGYDSREELIRDHWRRYGHTWNAAKMPSLKMAVKHKKYPYVPIQTRSETTELTFDNLRFDFERGQLDGQPAYRVTCEGVVLEERRI